VRTGTIAHGIQMVFEESEARTARAFYPHRAAMEQFQLTVLLKDWNERNDFVNWMSTYANYAIDPDIVQTTFPWMTVSVPSRGFSQVGIPLTGYEWGAHTGMMMFEPVIVFESAQSPGSSGQPQVSSVINQWSAFSSDPAIQYFYPFGTQLSGSQAPPNVTYYNGSPAAYNTANPGPGTVISTGPGSATVVGGGGRRIVS
jgi:hypothetical protein